MVNLPLFDDLPLPDSESTGQLLHKPGIVGSKHTLSKEQQAFNRLIGQIETKRQTLAAWEQAIQDFHQSYHADIVPILEKISLAEQTALRGFAAVLDGKGLGRADGRKLKQLTLELALRVLENLDGPDADQVKALYNRLSKGNYDREQANLMDSQIDAIKEVAEGLGVHITDDARTPEDILAEIERMETEQEERRSQRKKTARQQAKETKDAQEAAQVSQSIKEIYRKLASALHPDRESDALERERKTVLMQRVNQAYENKNLLELLALQLELEHIDQAHLSGLSPEKVRRYNLVLKGQVAEIDQEIQGRIQALSLDFSLPLYAVKKPEALAQLIKQEVKNLKAALAQAQQMAELSKDINGIKAYIKYEYGGEC